MGAKSSTSKKSGESLAETDTAEPQKTPNSQQDSGLTKQSTGNRPISEESTLNIHISEQSTVDDRHEGNSGHLWFWQTGNYKWRPFDADASDTVEVCFANNPRDKITVHVRDQMIEVNLATLQQTNIATGRQHSIKRVPPLKSITTRDHNEKDYVWQWNTDENTWEDYGSSSKFPLSTAIETAYVSDRNSQIRFYSNRCSYVIDFDRMKQTNETTGMERRLRRLRLRTGDVAQEDIYPSTWTDMYDGGDLHLVPLSPKGDTAEEYLRVANQIASTMSIVFTSITRIQNNTVYERFHVYKTQMEKRLGRGNGIRYLFHGPNVNSVDAICQQGFDCRVNGNSLYGKGSYFARDAKYASEYNSNTLFVAQVLVGEYAIGEKDISRPPLKCDGTLFDSCVNNLENPTIFVVFDIAHSYPEYLIEYQKIPDDDGDQYESVYSAAGGGWPGNDDSSQNGVEVNEIRQHGVTGSDSIEQDVFGSQAVALEPVERAAVIMLGEFERSDIADLYTGYEQPSDTEQDEMNVADVGPLETVTSDCDSESDVDFSGEFYDEPIRQRPWNGAISYRSA